MPADIVLICGAGYVSGKEIIAADLVNGLCDRGQRVHVAMSKWSDGEFASRLEPDLGSLTVLPIGFISTGSSLRLQRMNATQLLHMPALFIRYARLLRRVRPGRVLHTNWHHVLLLYPLLRPSDIFWLHEIPPNTPRYSRLFRLMATRLHGFICVSHAVAHSLQNLGIDDDKIRVIHNGVQVPDEVRRGPTGKGLRVGIVGQVAPWKGHEDLIEAFASLLGDFAATRLLIFGTGEQVFMQKLKDRIEALGISQAVDWMGFVRHQHEIYSTLDICVMPTRTPEPFGMTAVEAASYGLPVIATRRGGLPEIVENEATGLLVEAAAPEALASALRRLLGSPSLRQSMGIQARKRAECIFTRTRFIDQFAQALDVPGAGKVHA